MASSTSSTTEMTIPNDLIGCIIGKGGAKINEIRQLSGATIKISNSEESSKDRTVSISGTPESINLAQYLINTSMELHKNLTLDPGSNPSAGGGHQQPPNHPMAIPLTQLVKPSPLALAAASAGLPSSATAGSTTAAAAAAASLFAAATDLNSCLSSQARVKPLTTKLRATAVGLPPGLLENGNKSKADRKFAPY
jgi:hypothetical protein